MAILLWLILALGSATRTFTRTLRRCLPRFQQVPSHPEYVRLENFVQEIRDPTPYKITVEYQINHETWANEIIDLRKFFGFINIGTLRNKIDNSLRYKIQNWKGIKNFDLQPVAGEIRLLPQWGPLYESYGTKFRLLEKSNATV